MEHLNQEPSQDPFEVEISDLSGGETDEPEEHHPSTRLTSQARFSPRARARRILLVAAAFLVLLVSILGGQPTVRNQVMSLVQGFIPTPIPTLAPGTDRFYIAPDVPWTTVRLDGQPIALPRIGEDVPLHLVRGQHLIRWTAEPFQPQQCSIDVPPSATSSCPIIDQVRQGVSGSLVSVIGLHESLDTLPAAQQQALTQAVQRALGGLNDIVQPGEPYLIESGEPIPNVFGTGIAKQPLRATLQLPLDTDAPTDTCFLNPRNSETLRCALAGQDCARFCTVPWQARQADTTAADKLEWETLAVIYPPSWNYATEAGVSSTQNQPVCACGAATREALVLLHIAWDGLAWQVQPLFGPNQGPPLVVDSIPVADDPACLVAEEVFPEEVHTYVQLRFISGPNPAIGCLLEATLTTPEGTPAAAASVEEYLARFGEVVTVNDLAHQRNPQWPPADAYEQQIASQLATLPGGLTITGQP